MTLHGGKELDRRLAAIGSPQTRRQANTHLGLRAVYHAKRLVHRKTANLARTIRVDEVTDDHVVISAGGTRNVGYAAAEEFGSKAHDIVPKPGRIGRNGRPATLAWGGKRRLSGSCRTGAKPTMFRRKVRHPGTKAHPYMRPGAQAALDEGGVADAIVTAWNSAA